MSDVKDPSRFFNLSWLPMPAPCARDPLSVKRDRRLRTELCRRLADLTPQNFATLLWLTEYEKDFPNEDGVTGDREGCLMDVANRVHWKVYGAFELLFEDDPDP